MPVNWDDNSGAVMDEIIKKMYRNMNSVGTHLRTKTIENISLGATGQVVGGRRPKHPDPGGFPRRDTGQLIRSIGYKVDDLVDRLVVTLGAHTEYAEGLEFGGSPRWPDNLKFPFLIPTIDDERREIVRRIAKGLF